MSSSNLAASQSSTLSMPYLDTDKIVEKLDKIFGRNNYQIKLSLDNYTITAKRPLTDAEKKSIVEHAKVHYRG